ncbi:UPF0104 family protein [Sphingobacteriales bacterium UPWRP_1]|nr:hypothetical protein BVG80_13980 [Sphingobacteriales bacterium TSM_CSM]PSJ77090.1 UPF0104 family protein [Sphingobacteriales bacterium UPWRP_1]
MLKKQNLTKAALPFLLTNTIKLLKTPPLRRHIANILKPLLFLGIGLLLVWWSLKGFDSDARTKIVLALKEANYFWILVSMGFAILSHISRAMRWQMLIECVAPKPGLTNSFLAVAISYLANLAFPRMGEITRCGIISRYEPVPPEKAFGTVLIERAIDVFTLFVLTLLVVFTQFNVLGNYFTEKVAIPISGKFSALVFGFSLRQYLLLLLLGVLAVLTFLYVTKKFSQTVVYQKIMSTLQGVWEGVLSVRNVYNLPLLIGHSVFIWAMYFAMIYICFFSFDSTRHLGPQAGLAVMVLGSFGIIATQGGIGAYQIIVAGVLALYGVEYTLAYAFSWLVWGSQTVLVLVGGFAAMVALPLLNRQKQLVASQQAAG